MQYHFNSSGDWDDEDNWANGDYPFEEAILPGDVILVDESTIATLNIDYNVYGAEFNLEGTLVGLKGDDGKDAEQGGADGLSDGGTTRLTFKNGSTLIHTGNFAAPSSGNGGKGASNSWDYPPGGNGKNGGTLQVLFEYGSKLIYNGGLWVLGSTGAGGDAGKDDHNGGENSNEELGASNGGDAGNTAGKLQIATHPGIYIALESFVPGTKGNDGTSYFPYTAGRGGQEIAEHGIGPQTEAIPGHRLYVSVDISINYPGDNQYQGSDLTRPQLIYDNVTIKATGESSLGLGMLPIIRSDPRGVGSILEWYGTGPLVFSHSDAAPETPHSRALTEKIHAYTPFTVGESNGGVFFNGTTVYWKSRSAKEYYDLTGRLGFEDGNTTGLYFVNDYPPLASEVNFTNLSEWVSQTGSVGTSVPGQTLEVAESGGICSRENNETINQQGTARKSESGGDSHRRGKYGTHKITNVTPKDVKGGSFGGDSKPSV